MDDGRPGLVEGLVPDGGCKELHFWFEVVGWVGRGEGGWGGGVLGEGAFSDYRDCLRGFFPDEGGSLDEDFFSHLGGDEVHFVD